MNPSHHNPKEYDARGLDKFYAYCRATAEMRAHRLNVTRSWRAARRMTWKILLAGIVLGYLLIEWVSQGP
jgi:hypothetical protein